MRNMQARRHQYRARIGRPPQHRIAFVEPRENPVPIRVDKTLHAQRAAGCEQTIGVIERLVDGRERVSRSEKRDHAKLGLPLGMVSVAWFGFTSGKARLSGAKLVPRPTV